VPPDDPAQAAGRGALAQASAAPSGGSWCK
jgi:hypothetical protein